MANLIKISGGSNANIQGKALFNATPTYNIGRSLSAVNEGSSVTFTLSTTNVSNGTVLPYTISGISANDVTTGSLTGSFTVNSGLATTTITMSADQLTEGAETATLTLNNAAASNFVVVNDTSVWTPNLISGLQLWLDASDTSTLYNATAGGSLVTTDGATVARWQDKSGNNRHATQATSNARPLLRILNGVRTIKFDGANDFLTLGDILRYNTGDFTFQYWAYFDSFTTNSAGQGPVVFYKGQYGTNGYYQQILQSANVWFGVNRSGGVSSSVSVSTIQTGNWVNIAITKSSTTVKIYLNGILNSTTENISNVLSGNTPFQLGAYATVIFGNFRIQQFLSYNSALTDSQILNVYNYNKPV